MNDTKKLLRICRRFKYLLVKIVLLARYHFVLFIFFSLKNFSCERNVYTMFLRPKLAASYLRRAPKPRLKLAAAYFSRKEIVRLY